MRIILKESQVVQLLEVFDSEKLYKKEYIVNVLKKAPREYKRYISLLDTVECYDNDGNKHECVKIPQFIYQYLVGRY